MGANFLCTWLDLRDGTPEILDELFRIWYGRVNRIRILEQIDVDMAFFDCISDDEDEVGDNTMLRVRAVLYDDLKVLRVGVNDEDRSAFVMFPPRSEYGGRPTRVLMCGGDSWGDSSSDLFDGLQRLYAASIFDLTVTEETVLAYRLAKQRGRVVQSEKLAGSLDCSVK